jgi:hypothetical protein
VAPQAFGRVNTLLAAGTGVASLAALALVAWVAALPFRAARLTAAAAVALLAWLLLPLATETGLRDLARWLGEQGRARDLAALAMLDGMAGVALTVRGLWGTAGPRERALLRWMPPLTTPLAVFALCVIATQSVDALDFGTLRLLVAGASLAAVFALGALLAAAMPALAARIELRLVIALATALAAAWLAALASSPPAGTAPTVDVVALGTLLAGALLIVIAGFLREHWRSRR